VRRLPLLAILLACLSPGRPALAEEAGTALLLPGYFLSSDSEDFSVRKTAVGFAPIYRSGNDYTAVRAARNRYATADWAVESAQFSAARTALDAHSGLGYQAALGVHDIGGRPLLTADMDYSRAFGVATRGGLFLSRDWVETRAALTDGISHTYFGGSIEQTLAPGWTGIALLGQQRFSDDNVRDHARLRLIYDLMPQGGLNVQYRHRHFWNSSPWGRSYFSPDVYYEDMLALGMRRRLEGWMLAATLGLGQQHVSGDASMPTHLAELEATSPLAGTVFLRARAGYSDSAALTGPNYIYRYLQAEILVRF
jgi:hypothetical protein